MSFLKNLLNSGSNEFTKVENSQRFNFMLQQMQSNRWKITLIILLTFFFIIFGIVMSVMFKASIQESWKELLLLLLGAFVGNLNKVIDYWFSNEDRDKMLVQKMDEEDNSSESDVTEIYYEKVSIHTITIQFIQL
jgi:antibiotic biosynthesis monooxygenase (ABM) superfamily enzyme